MSGNYF